MGTHTHTHIYIYTYIYMYTHIYIYIFIYTIGIILIDNFRNDFYQGKIGTQHVLPMKIVLQTSKFGM